MKSVEVYAWHGTTGVAANKIAKEGFDASKIGKKFGKESTHAFGNEL